MARTPSMMVPLGTPMPAFALSDGHGVVHASTEFTGGLGTLVIFMCNHCPFVVHVADQLAALGRDLADSGLGIVAINSNDVASHPDDAPDRMVEFAEHYGLVFPYLHDETQDVARAFAAACTPDFFLFDGDESLVYRGQLDDSRPDSGTPVTGADLRAAIDAVLAGEPVQVEQVPALGCNIKWKAGTDCCGEHA